MTTSAQISVYPLKQEHLSPAVEAVRTALVKHKLAPHVGPMSTSVSGETDMVFAAVADAFSQAARNGRVVMNITVSSPIPS